MNGAKAYYLYFDYGDIKIHNVGKLRRDFNKVSSSERLVCCIEFLEWSKLEQSLVQILLVVVNIQMRNLKTEVNKGFMWTVFDHELVDPKIRDKVPEIKKN